MNGIARTSSDLPLEVYVIIVTGLVLTTLLIFGLLAFVRWYRKQAESRVSKYFEGVAWRKVPIPGDCHLQFSVYVGLLGNGSRHLYTLWLPLKDGVMLLKRLHSFNLRYGWLMLGPLIWISSRLDYSRALRRLMSSEVPDNA